MSMGSYFHKYFFKCYPQPLGTEGLSRDFGYAPIFMKFWQKLLSIVAYNSRWSLPNKPMINRTFSLAFSKTFQTQLSSLRVSGKSLQSAMGTNVSTRNFTGSVGFMKYIAQGNKLKEYLLCT